MEPTALLHPRPLDSLIFDQAASRGSAPYLFAARSSASLSYGELLSAVTSRQEQLRLWGLGAGTRVGLLIGDPLNFSTWFLAGLSAGVWVAPLDPTVTPQNQQFVNQRATALNLSAILADRDDESATMLAWINVNAGVTTCEYDVPGDDVSHGGVLLSSSGTTGTPKVMALSAKQLLDTASLIAEHNALVDTDRGFNPLPLWHVNAEVVGLLATLVAGASLVLDDRFHRTGFWKIVDDFEVTWINAVPAIISRLATLQGDESPPRRVRFIRSASAPLSPLLFDEFESAIGIPIIQSYGMTEAASQICVNPLNGVRKSGSVGVPVGVEVRVASVETETLSDVGEVGHIEIKGPTVIRSYESAAYDDRFDVEGWLRTGDLGYFDEDNYLFIVGRTDDVINRGGEKIYPLEIENVLAALEGVAIVAVIGEPDVVFGQVPVAFIQPDDLGILNSPGAMGELVARVRARAVGAFARAYRPASVKIVRGFPSHATGKIQRGPLRHGDVPVVYEERL